MNSSLALLVLTLTARAPRRAAGLFMFGVVGTWLQSVIRLVALLVVGREDILLAVLFLTSYHDVQYHAIVWLVGSRRSRGRSVPMRTSVRSMFGSVPAFAAAIVPLGVAAASFVRSSRTTALATLRLVGVGMLVPITLMVAHTMSLGWSVWWRKTDGCASAYS